MPTVYYFNPGHEYAIVNESPYYMPATNMLKMQEDLAFLCAWYAKSDSFVLVPNNINSDYQHKLKKNGICVPKAIQPNQFISSGNRTSSIHCWGISPQSINYFRSIDKLYHLNLGIPTWNHELKYFTSREFSKDCLIYLIEQNKEISNDIVPYYFSSLSELESFIDSSTSLFVAKAPYSSSGKGLLWLPEDGLTRTERQILHGIIKKQNTVSLEKVHNRIIDFAMEFNLNNTHCSFCGYSLFNTNSKGKYESNYIGSQESISKILQTYIKPKLLEKIKEDLIRFFATKINKLYDGTIGVDMMIYKKNDSYNLHPCVEINVRDNMGIVALNIYKQYIVSDSEGYFFIDYHKEEGVLKKSDLEMSNKYPLICSEGKIKSGYLSLCPITEKTKYRAYILIH